MNILGVITARGGSKGIKGKNIRSFCGKPLIQWTIDAARESALIDRFVVSTDSEAIATIAKEGGAEVPFLRPRELAEDSTPSLPVIEHAVAYMEKEAKYKSDIIVLLQPTSPLRTGKHIDEALQLLLNANMADSVVSVTEVPHTHVPHSVMSVVDNVLIPYKEMHGEENIRQNMQAFFARNGAIYACTVQCLLNKRSFYGDKILPYIMQQEHSFDIDTALDFKLCEFIRSQTNVPTNLFSGGKHG